MKWLAIALALLLSPTVALGHAEAPLASDWIGTITANGLPLHIALHFGMKTTFDSLDQNAKGLAANSARQGNVVKVEVPIMRGHFDLTLSSDGQTLTGTLDQGGLTVPVTLHQGLVAAAARPQTPIKPYPYREEEVRYPNPKAPGVVLAGTLTLPQGKGPFPVALLITGSGSQDRDETIFDHKPFLVIADYLTRRGIAVLRLDDRGMGGSTGASANDTTADFATDVEAGVAWLKTRRDINPKKIGLIGHSEGGMIATMVASKDPSIAFVVMLAGPGVRGADIIVEQSRLGNLAAGGTPQSTARTADIEKAILDAMQVAPDGPSAEAAGLKAVHALIGPNAGSGIALMASPWYRAFIAYDPAPALRAIKVPILALDGTKDIEVSAAQNLPAIKAANPRAETVQLPGLNHLFQTAKTGAPQEYAQIEETFSPKALTLVGDWIIKVTSQP